MNFCVVFVTAVCLSGVFGICTIDEAKSLIDQIRTKLWLVEQLVDKESEMCKENEKRTECPTQPSPTTTETTTTEPTTTTTTEPTTTTTTTEPTTTTTEPLCPDGREFNGHCYYLSKRRTNWSSAKDACKEKSSHLAVVETREENTFLRDWAKNNSASIWLDGSDELNEGQWIWTSTGQPFTYTGWRAGDPDGARSQNCLVIHSSYSYRWIDTKCDSNSYQYVCENEN